MDDLVRAIVNGLGLGTLYGLLALGFVLIYKGSGIINFSQAELVVFSAFLSAWLLSDLQLPLWVGLLITIGAMVILGGLVELLFVRPLINESRLSLALSTLGLGSILRGLAPLIWDPKVKTYPRVISEEPVRIMEGVTVPLLYLWVVVIGVGFMWMFTAFFKRSRTGIAMQAVSEDPQAARSLGVDIIRLNGLSWAISGIVAAACGFVWGYVLNVSLDLLSLGFFVFPVVILGGMDSLLGAMVGGLVIGLLENLTGAYIDPLVGGGVGFVVPFLLLVLVLMVRPFGLFGRPDIERV